jgi:hypothetical protein
LKSHTAKRESLASVGTYEKRVRTAFFPQVAD